MSVCEFQVWARGKPDPDRVFCVYEPLADRVTMVRELHDDDLSGDVTWCPHTGKEHFGDMEPDFRWCYAPRPRGESLR